MCPEDPALGPWGRVLPTSVSASGSRQQTGEDGHAETGGLSESAAARRRQDEREPPPSRSSRGEPPARLAEVWGQDGGDRAAGTGRPAPLSLTPHTCPASSPPRARLGEALIPSTQRTGGAHRAPAQGLMKDPCEFKASGMDNYSSKQNTFRWP